MPDLAPQLGEVTLRGSVLVLLQFDVCEAIRLDALQELIRARTVQLPRLNQPAPGYIRYQRTPIVERLETLVLEGGERLQGEMKYFDYGVLSLVFELPFSGSWSMESLFSNRNGPLPCCKNLLLSFEWLLQRLPQGCSRLPNASPGGLVA